MKKFVGAFAALSLLASAAVSHGTTITLNAAADTWVAYGSGGSYSTTTRETDTTINVRAGSTSATATTSSMRMMGVLEFDLSALPAGATITDAHVQMFMPAAPGGSGNSGTGIDKARLIQLSANAINGNAGLDWGPTDIDPSNLTYKTSGATHGYSDYTSTGADTLQAKDFLTESFGWYNYATTLTPQNTYVASAGPSANDLAYIQGVYNDSWKKLGVVLDPQSGTTSGSSRDIHFWSSSRDLDPDTSAPRFPQLVVTYSVPEPSSFVLMAASILSGVTLLARRRR